MRFLLRALFRFQVGLILQKDCRTAPQLFGVIFCRDSALTFSQEPPVQSNLPQVALFMARILRFFSVGFNPPYFFSLPQLSPSPTLRGGLKFFGLFLLSPSALLFPSLHPPPFFSVGCLPTLLIHVLSVISVHQAPWRLVLLGLSPPPLNFPPDSETLKLLHLFEHDFLIR